MTLRDIASPVQLHLDRFDAIFRESMRSRIGLVDLVVRYLIRQKGKRVRPILVFLSAEVCGGVTERSFRGATLVEILHTATLVHDDVVDDADTRRGLPSINAVWKNKIAVLMGDYLLARGLLLSLDKDDVDFLKITSSAVRRMSEGELHQIAKSRKLNMNEEDYLRIIGDKTASLFSTCCEIGATSATGEREKVRLLHEYGELVGMAFQIRDDLLDYTGRTSITGKPVGLDLSEKKLTLPLVYALGKCPASEKRTILSMIRRGGKGMKVGTILDFVRARGGLEYADGRARDYAAQATERLSTLPPSPGRNALEGFARFVVEREK